MSDETGQSSRTWMWCLGLIVLYLASYAPVDVWSHRYRTGLASPTSPPPDPFAAPPPPPRWIEIAYGPAKRVYEWEAVYQPMNAYYQWWHDRL